MNNLADIVFAGILILCVVIGFRKGLIRSLFGLLSGIVAIVFAFASCQSFSDWLVSFLGSSGPSWIRIPILRKAISVLILFILFDILIHAVGSLLNRICRLPVLHQLNSLLGGVFGFFKGAVIVLLVCAVFHMSLPTGISEKIAGPVQKITSSYIYRSVYDHNLVYTIFKPNFFNEAGKK